jgi:hypothetical protein
MNVGRDNRRAKFVWNWRRIAMTIKASARLVVNIGHCQNQKARRSGPPGHTEMKRRQVLRRVGLRVERLTGVRLRAARVDRRFFDRVAMMLPLHRALEARGERNTTGRGLWLSR